MKLLNLMIVDDELVIRQGIVEMLDWASVGIQVIAQAANGKEAYELALLTHPDIVLSDIKMPLMDGLAFSKALLAKLPETKIVLLSGYSEFSYVQQALKMGVNDYLLKPVNLTELMDLMQNIAQQIHNTRNARNSIHQQQVTFQQHLPTLRGNHLQKFATNKMATAQFLQDAEACFSLQIQQGNCCACVLHLVPENQNDTAQETDLHRYAVLNIAEELFGKTCFGYLGETEILGCIDLQATPLQACQEICAQIQDAVSRYFKRTMLITIGSMAQTIAEYPASYQQAQALLTQELSQLQPSAVGPSHSLVSKSIGYMQAHYAENILVADVAAQIYITPNYLSKIFKQETGESFTEWLNKYRVEKAKEYILADPTTKSYAIADLVGFKDYKYFTFVFKKYTGFTPSNFKNSHTS